MSSESDSDYFNNARWRELPPTESIRVPRGAAADEVVARVRRMLVELPEDAADVSSHG